VTAVTLCGSCGGRDCEPVFRRSVHGRDATEALQPWSTRIRRVAVQPFRLLRRRLQHHRGCSDVHAGHAAPRRQRSSLCSTTQSLQSYPVSLLFAA